MVSTFKERTKELQKFLHRALRTTFYHKQKCVKHF